MQTVLPLPSHWKSTLSNVLVACIYFTLARASLILAYEFSNATPVWPCSGFALAVILLWGYKLIPGIAIGAFAANFVTFLTNKTCDAGTAAWVSVLISAGNTSEAFAGYILLAKLVNINNVFQRVKSIFQ